MFRYTVFHYLEHEDDRLVLKPVAVVYAGNLAAARDKTQHTEDGSWYDNEGVQPTRPGRSTRPGDLIARHTPDGVAGWYRVERDGFTEVDRPRVIVSAEELPA